MNKLQVFLKVRDHLLTQMEQSRGEDSRCAYRGTNGMMCAVGCLIKDEFYHAGLEYKNCGNAHVMIALEKSGIDVFSPDTMGLLSTLQKIHDDYHPDYWRQRLDDIQWMLT